MVVIKTSSGDKVEIDDDTARERGWERIKEAGAEERVKNLLSRAEKEGVSTNRVEKAILHLGAALTALESNNLPQTTRWELEGTLSHYEEHLVRELERLERKVSAKEKADKLAERLLEEEQPVIGFNVGDSGEAAKELAQALRKHGVRAILANLAFGYPRESERVVVVTDKESIERIVGEGKNEEVRERVKDHYSRLFSHLNTKVIAVLFVEEAREVARVLMERAED